MKLDYEPFELEFRHTWNISRISIQADTNYLVRLEHTGITGYGECCIVERYGESAQATERALAQARALFADADPWRYLDIENMLRANFPSLASLRAALEMALLDWLGKALNLPLFKMWGLNPSHSPRSSFSIGLDTPENMRKKVLEVPDDPILKIKLGVDNDREIVRAVREMTDRPIRVDVNEGWKNVTAAAERIQWLHTQNVEFVEQPLPAGKLAETEKLRALSPLPLIADEEVHTSKDIPRIAGAYDGINIKLMKSGGLLESLRMIHVAHALGLKVMLGCMLETSLAVTAAAHLAPLADYCDLDAHRLIIDDPFQGLEVEKGRLILPDRPGIGVEWRGKTAITDNQ